VIISTSRHNMSRFAWITIGPTLVTFLFWLTSANPVTPLQLLMALALLTIPIASYRSWSQTPSEKLPLFAILSFMYWLYYAVGLFWVEHTVALRNLPAARQLSVSSITASLFMALLGVSCLWLGMKSGVGARLTPKRVPSARVMNSNYLRVVLVLGTVLGFSQGAVYSAGEGGRQVITIFITTVPLLAFTMLLRGLFRGEATSVDKILLAGFLGLRFLSGMSSGWLGAFVGLIVIIGVLYLSERRKLPKIALFLVVAFTLFFQVGKEDFRRTYWKGGEQSDRIERVTYWVNASLSQWNDALDHPDSETIREILNPSFSRVSLLTQTANVVEQTPSEVPYQYGKLYSYIGVTFIPRFIWPDKPSVNEANQFYQVAYGLSGEDELDNVSIAVGVLTEAFINFGWFGVVGIMFLGGIFFDVYKRTFFSLETSAFMNALGIVLIPQFLAVESQLAQYLGGVFQQIVFTLIVMIPILRLRSTSSNLQPVAVTR
jgi:hypothetical protein